MLFCLLGLAAGCGPILSLNPLFTKDSLVFDERLLGAWRGDANDPNMSLEFARLDEGSAGNLPKELAGEAGRIYRMTLSEKGQPKGDLIACLVKLGERRFLDVFPNRFPSGESDPETTKLPFNASFFLHSHIFARVDAIGDRLTIGLTDDEGFRKLVEAEPKAVTYATTEDGLILTASTKELQAFVTKYAADQRLFPGETTFIRSRK